ncbi:putative zinc finger in N-recognin-domain-containing protein, partial [Pavlovales sp. CCMP2436]
MAISRQLNMEHFEAAANGARISAYFNKFKSKNHSIGLGYMEKKALAWGDDKAFTAPDGTTLSHGHYTSPSYGKIQKALRSVLSRAYIPNAIVISFTQRETQFYREIILASLPGTLGFARVATKMPATSTTRVAATRVAALQMSSEVADFVTVAQGTGFVTVCAFIGAELWRIRGVVGEGWYAEKGIASRAFIEESERRVSDFIKATAHNASLRFDNIDNAQGPRTAMAVIDAGLVSHLCTLPKAEAVAALKLQSGLPEQFVVALWSSLPIGDAIEWSTFLLCGSTTPCAPVGEGAQRRGVCGMVWRAGDTVYHCRTCGMDPSCAICAECFGSSDHEGHDYWMFSSGGGCCDCGDAEAWRPEGFCRHHSGVETAASDAEVLARLQPFTLACTEGVLTGWARLMLDRRRTLADQTRAVQWLTELAACSLTWRRLAGIALTAGGSGAGSQPHEQAAQDVASGAAAAGRAEGGEPSTSLLACFLRTEVRVTRSLREELHRLYFELMRDCDFKERLLCHIIEQQALDPAIAGEGPTDSATTTFGKFTVQFKGNMKGLLPMLLSTLFA